MRNAELAILTLIAEKPRHGYEIEQVIEARGMREWTEVGFSSIYYLLKKLERGGLIKGRTERQSGKGPARKVFQITAKGQEANRFGAIEALTVPHHCYPPIQLGLANLPSLSVAESITALHEYHISLTDRLELVQARLDKQQPVPYFVEAMFAYSTTLLQAERTWVGEFIKKLEETND